MLTGTTTSGPEPTLTTLARFKDLTSNQKRGFLAAWGGWALDGMDSFIYALVLVPALFIVLLGPAGIQITEAFANP